MAEHGQGQHFEWQAPEFKHYEKSAVWYVLAVAAVLALTGYQVLAKDYFGAATMLILGVLIVWFARQKPKIITVVLDGTGIALGDLRIPYRHFKHFWIAEMPDHNTLNLEASTYLRQTIIVELGDQDGEAIHKFLKKHLPEAEEQEPSLSQRIAHRFHF